MLEELAREPKYTLTPDEVSVILGIHAQRIRDLARTDPKGLGFPVIVAGRTTLIPKVPFLRFMGYEGEVVLP